jgi:hypothetical protein
VIDTRNEFFNDDEFDWPNEKSRYEKNFYAYQLATFFRQVVQKEIFSKAAKELNLESTINYLIEDQELREGCRRALVADSGFDIAIATATLILEDRLRKKSAPMSQMSGDKAS